MGTDNNSSQINLKQMQQWHETCSPLCRTVRLQNWDTLGRSRWQGWWHWAGDDDEGQWEWESDLGKEKDCGERGWRRGWINEQPPHGALREKTSKMAVGINTLKHAQTDRCRFCCFHPWFLFNNISLTVRIKIFCQDYVVFVSSVIIIHLVLVFFFKLFLNRSTQQIFNSTKT